MRELKINGIYKHFKGDYYLVVDTANHPTFAVQFLKWFN